MKYFAWDDAKNAKLRREGIIGSEDIVFHSEHCDLLCPLLPLREGHVPQGPAAEHPAVEQGPGGDSEASARGGIETLISSLLHKYASGRLKEV
jgi:hypothetical protein